MNEKKNFERLVIFAIATTMCLSALAVLPTVSAAGADYYVSPTGSDSNDGLTPATAWATINKGTCSLSPLTSGDILHVADGTYTITGRIWVEKAGITVSGNTASPENVVVQYSSPCGNLLFDMRASNVTIEGIKAKNGKAGFWFDQSAVTGCTISHCIVENANEHGIYVHTGGNNHTIEYTTITNPGQCGSLSYSNGIFVQNAIGTTINNCIITSNKVKHMKWGIDLESGADTTVITGNTITGSWQAAIRVASHVKPVTITNNDIDDATEGYQYEGAISLDGYNDGSIISGNHIDNVVASSAIVVWPAGDITIANNKIGVDDALNDVRLEGIRVSGCGGSGANRVEVTGNTIHNTGHAAIMLINSDNTYVYSNIIEDCNNYGDDGTGYWNYASIHVDENSDNVIVDNNDISDGINGIQVWGDNCQVTNNEIYDMGLTYADTKGTGDGTYYNSGIIIGSNWLTGNFKPTGTTVTCNNIHDNYWGLYVRDYANLSLGDPSVLSVTAECNWWGHKSGPGGVGPGKGDAVSNNVDYDPWLCKPWFQIDKAKIDFKKKPDDDKVRVKGKLGFDLVCGDGVAISEDVTVTVGPLSETIIMEEKGKKGEKWEYKRPKGGDGNIKHMTINWKNGKFDVRMDKADLSGVTNPVTIGIQIGDDIGEETILMTEKKHHWDYKA